MFVDSVAVTHAEESAMGLPHGDLGSVTAASGRHWSLHE